MEEKTIRETMVKIEAIIRGIALTVEHPPEPPTAPLLDGRRLDRIWKYLQGWLGPVKYGELEAWAKSGNGFGYRYYIPGQKYPKDLRTQVCDLLSGFTESQIAELEKILEVSQ